MKRFYLTLVACSVPLSNAYADFFNKPRASCDYYSAHYNEESQTISVDAMSSTHSPPTFFFDDVQLDLDFDICNQSSAYIESVSVPTGEHTFMTKFADGTELKDSGYFPQALRIVNFSGGETVSKSKGFEVEIEGQEATYPGCGALSSRWLPDDSVEINYVYVPAISGLCTFDPKAIEDFGDEVEILTVNVEQTLKLDNGVERTLEFSYMSSKILLQLAE